MHTDHHLPVGGSRSAVSISQGSRAESLSRSHSGEMVVSVAGHFSSTSQ